MSFSGEVKEELQKSFPSDKEAAMAEIGAVLLFCLERIVSQNGKTTLIMKPEHDFLIEKVFTLIKKFISINSGIQESTITVSGTFPGNLLDFESGELYQETATKRAFLRGAFLCVGSMSDPQKSYHLEFACPTEEQAVTIQRIIADFDLDAKIVERQRYHVVYIKDGSAICDLLNIMGAHGALLNFETFRVWKDMRNSINRKVNCETANIAKTVNAAARQAADIELIRDTWGLGELSPQLREIAELRLEYRDATLQELGELLEPPVGKSGVNHRLKKLGELADRIRKQ